MVPEPTQDMEDIERLAEASALMDHEIQKMVVLLRQAPPDVRAMILETAEEMPDYGTLREHVFEVAVAVRNLNRSIQRIMRELQEPPEQTPQEQNGDGD